MMKRRDVLRSVAVGATAGVLAGAAKPARSDIGATTGAAGAEDGGGGPVEQTHNIARAVASAGVDADLRAAVRSAPPMNLARAYQVLEEENLSGLVLADPLNVYHLTGYWPVLAKMGYPAPVFALLAADPRQPPGLVMSQFLYYYAVADAGFQYPLQTWLFRTWEVDRSAFGTEPGQVDAEPAATPYIFENLGQAPLGAIEKNRLAVLERTISDRKLNTGVDVALLKAVREMGLNRGAIGIDHLATAAFFETANLQAKPRRAENVLRKIRLIKSDNEIKLMRRATAINAEAALAAARTVREGATYQELRAAFFAETSRLGNSPAFMSIDRMASEVGDAPIRDGQGFFIDCVSHLLHYHGDYGRTIFVGEPARSMRRATDAMCLGWDAVRERLRPGLRYSEIKTIGNEAVRKAGYRFDIAFTPHSVGLMHTDEPGRDGTPFWVKDDLVLEENMILSVDCPVRNTGIGGSAHLEDLTLITKDGSEQINDIGDRIIIV